jgi:Asp-tRNA(Asn)/Glu-tRNA(Gln) amidotransferase A subunit family amidase
LPDLFAEHDVDVILKLSAPGPAREGYATTGDSRFNRLWTLMSIPCVTVPVRNTLTGLPLGVQIIARLGDDARALTAAHFAETLMHEHHR